MLRKLGLILSSTALLLLTTCLAPPGFANDKTVALFPIKIISPRPVPYLEQGMKVMFVSRLAEVGLHAITDQVLGKYLSNEERQGRISSDRAQEIAQKVNAQYAIFGTLTAIGKGLSLDLQSSPTSRRPQQRMNLSPGLRMLPIDSGQSLRAPIRHLPRKEPRLEVKKKGPAVHFISWGPKGLLRKGKTRACLYPRSQEQ
ncbi:MAG: hypothetical protein JRI39_15120 [Deltaproteobacteria bacterium]|nr:hypothetical protein [Deltaproteobacteria bacterium]